MRSRTAVGRFASFPPELSAQLARRFFEGFAQPFGQMLSSAIDAAINGSIGYQVPISRGSPLSRA
jgi:hypothetical protein